MALIRGYSPGGIKSHMWRAGESKEGIPNGTLVSHCGLWYFDAEIRRVRKSLFTDCKRCAAIAKAKGPDGHPAES